MADNLLKIQQSEKSDLGVTWDSYFPFDAKDVSSIQTNSSAFIDVLRNSLYRPRDIVNMLNLLQKHYILQKRVGNFFIHSDLQDPNFKKELAYYYLGEIKDQLAFYYSEKDYQTFLKFFNFLKGSRSFTYDDFVSSYNKYIHYLNKNDIPSPIFCLKPETFLQFLYDLNIICYTEQTPQQKFTRWCYRERNYANISPKVEINKIYLIHQGMRKAFNIGQKIY
jgi:hypothetical protein